MVENRAAKAGDGDPFQDSCLGNSRDRGTWGTIVYGVTKESDKHRFTPFCLISCFIILCFLIIHFENIEMGISSVFQREG